MKKMFLLTIVFSFAAFAQITITSSDVAAMFAVGNTVTIYSDSLESTVDIGNPGGGNNWDFTNLQSQLEADFESIDPSTSPYIDDFPDANICAHNTSNVGGMQTEIWTYSKLNGNYDILGNVSTSSSFPGFVTEINYDPYRRESELPTTINSNWTSSFTQTILLNGTPVSNSNVTSTVTVDAYGTMTIPGGASYEALRLREELTVSGITSVNYSFLAKNGAQVNVSASDENPPNSGVIDVDGTNYYGALTSTDVEQISGLPESFSLSQNYPNPFNPSTLLEYSIPEESFVQLKVYDILGNEVAILVNQEQTAGIYKVDFTADNLASGLYIARITAGNFSKTIKMTLLR